MKLSMFFAAALAASADAAAFDRRQRVPDVGKCGLDSFEGHTSEALVFCSNILKSGTATETTTRGGTTIVTTTRRVTTTSYVKRPTSSPSPKPTLTPTSTPRPTSTPQPPSSSPPPRPSSTIVSSPSPSPTGTTGCGIVAYVKSTPAYYFESSGTKNNFSACQALCKADTKCKSFGYGEANCMLFDVLAEDNTNYNPMSPYTFYDITCPKELPVRKRQIDVTLPIPGGINISLGLGGPREISSACSCLITHGPAETTVTRTVTSDTTRTATTTTTTTVTRTADGDDNRGQP